MALRLCGRDDCNRRLKKEGDQRKDEAGNIMCGRCWKRGAHLATFQESMTSTRCVSA